MVVNFRRKIRLSHQLMNGLRHYSRISTPRPVGPDPVIRVVNNIAQLGSRKEGPKPRQLLSLPRFPSDPLPARCLTKCANEKKSARVTAISWVKYYFDGVHDSIIQSHFNKNLVQMEDPCTEDTLSITRKKSMRKIKHNEVMKAGARIYVPVSIAESRISKRFDPIPCGTLNPNADEIAYLQRLVMYKDSAIIVLNKPPKLPVKGNLPVHNSMDALAAAALTYDYEEGPQLVHRLDRETSGILLMGRTKETVSYLQQLFTNVNVAKTSCLAWNEACNATFMRYWALVIGCPREKEGVICAPLTKVLLDDGQTERIMLAHPSGVEPSQEAVTEYRVLGPMINGCSWLELRPHTSRKHQLHGTWNVATFRDLHPQSPRKQPILLKVTFRCRRPFTKLRVHCAQALGTPIVGDYKYGWLMHRKWKQTPQVNIEPLSGEPYKLRRPDGLDVQKGSVLSKVPLLHLHCREIVLPNIAKFIGVLEQRSTKHHPKHNEKPDVLRFVASMPSHMKISWNLMSSYLV